LHEKIRVHSHAAARQMNEQGTPNDLIRRLQQDPAFSGLEPTVFESAKYIGRAPEQVDAFIRDYISPLRETYAKDLETDIEALRV